MKRFILWTLILFFTFAFGVVAALLWLNRSADDSSSENKILFAGLPILNYCELRNNADKYDGKIIRLQTEVNTGNHGEFLYDARCPGDEKITTYADATAAVMYIDWLEQRKTTSIRNGRRTKPWTDPVGVIAVGKFRKNEPMKGESALDRSAVFHFTVISLEVIPESDH